jgi:hypothetical protein
VAEPADIQHHLAVSATTKVIGRVRGGATVQAGAALTVQGVLEGPVTVESEGILVVQGTFSGDIVRNEGIVMLHGVVVMNDSPPEGAFTIGIGSVITSDGNA